MHTSDVAVEVGTDGLECAVVEANVRKRRATSKSYGTFSVSVGTAACNAKCPFCVAHMTPDTHAGSNAQRISFGELNQMLECLRRSAEFARNAHIPTLLITGKGEPLLNPEEISLVLHEVQPYRFPIIELQTNGLWLARESEPAAFYLGQWKNCGLKTVAVSVVHYRQEKNSEVYTPKGDYPDLPALITRLRRYGFSIRLSVVMARGFIDSVSEVEKMIQFGRDHDVQQLTFRPVAKPGESRNEGAAAWVTNASLKQQELDDIGAFLEQRGTLLDVLPHGAVVFDVSGQNVCLTNCLTHDPEGPEIRQVINFFRAARFGYSWEYPGATLF